MLKYLVKRFAYMIFVFFIMTIVLFWLYSLIPGDPAAMAIQHLKDQLHPDEYERMYLQYREMYGLDDPVYVQYFRWASTFLRGDFGWSRYYKKEVIEIIKTPLQTTITYNLFVVTAVFLITIPLGIVSAVKKNSTFDKIVQVVTVVGYSIPSFIFALVFIYIFAVRLGWFPVSGMRTPNFSGTQWQAFLDLAWHMGLPIIALTFASLGGMTRYVRAAMIDALALDCIRTARAKGLKERVVILSHAWRNALLGIVTLMIAFSMSLFSGALILETMFNIHGMGKFLYDSLRNMDYNVTLTMQLFYVVIALITNLLIDLSYGLVDPRVRIDK
ncbi:peptide/nickel transport system permease protein [Anaerobranca californiensis DSM 14826]|jgi:peptide/nickel transport system permease protein|uniref:Peptide/nickel transport system permease protein n=1 Tax=Anaerobranca californiensis DSM 14826 TaxID=1120989 RepID=A0A1M6PRB4_9FIRM|nr:ABC transporter permease [Anaerobranca californiensis]SHK10408.1 peptide/nickel transport system permease protein [Anaerobranca californiensis DSM 14826]